MTSIRCIIVDDEPPALRLLKSYVEKASSLELLLATTKPLEALQTLNTEAVDLVFLDVQMPDLTGIQISKLINTNAKVIFTTAYPQFAIESYELNAIDYLLKPITFERFYKAVLKAEQAIKKTDYSAISNNDAFIFIKTDGKNNFEKVYKDDILYVESIKNYVAIHLKDHQIITYHSLKSILASLSKDAFAQIHKSYIVSLKHIDKTDSFTVSIQQQHLPIGETYKADFFKRIQKRRL